MRTSGEVKAFDKKKTGMMDVVPPELDRIFTDLFVRFAAEMAVGETQKLEDERGAGSNNRPACVRPTMEYCLPLCKVGQHPIAHVHVYICLC